MTWRPIAWFIAAYVALVAGIVSFNLAVLCLGAPKYANGCGGFGTYIPLWLMFLSPLPIAAIALESRRGAPPSSGRLLAYLAAIAAILELGWLVIERFPVLLLVESIAIGLGWMARRNRPRQ
jgi:hypothetical protein